MPFVFVAIRYLNSAFKQPSISVDKLQDGIADGARFDAKEIRSYTLQFLGVSGNPRIFPLGKNLCLDSVEIMYYYRTGRIDEGYGMRQTIGSTRDLAEFIKNHRKSPRNVSSRSGGSVWAGSAFIGDLERGKETCEIGKILHVLIMLGIELQVSTRTRHK